MNTMSKTRFAPSPTGYMHLGHVVNAIYVWGIARRRGAEVLLRIEDHDRVRCRPEFEAALLEDLAWLGFVSDGGSAPLLRQSDSPAVYQEALNDLRRRHHVYTCVCSRREIGGERYTGRCRDLGLPETAGCGLRVQLAPGREVFEDGLLGRLEQAPADQCGDLLLRDRDGHWTYQFAVTVDDWRQGVTLVIRGEDLVSSTGRQIALARMLGRATAPAFIHHPLIVKLDGEKLSKSSGDTGIRELRAVGLSPAEVIGRAASAVGLIRNYRPLEQSEVAALFP
jgi:glutamyl-tRNA synthetase/glutamyl-Q tRNA(Asp) synthetase